MGMILATRLRCESYRMWQDTFTQVGNSTGSITTKNERAKEGTISGVCIAARTARGNRQRETCVLSVVGLTVHTAIRNHFT